LKKIADKEGISTEEEALHLIAQKADGAMRDALSMFDLIVTFSGDNSVTYAKTIKNLHILDYDYYFRLCDFFLVENTSQVLLLFDEILRNGFDGHNFLSGLQEHLRNLLVCKDAGTVKLLQVPEKIAQRYQEQAKQVSASFIMSGLNLLNQADLSYKSSKNQRLHTEIALLKLTHMQRAIQLAADPEKKKSA
jgi:DNA polymerase-3 subunit gamma/tau